MLNEHNVVNRLDLDTIREFIVKEEPDVEVLELLDESPGTNPGDNYCSMIYRLEIKGLKRTTNEPWHKSIIYKVLPKLKEHRDTYKSDELFMNEIVFYTKVWPAFLELQHNGRQVFDGVAKVYLAEPEFIVMEDLKAKGFQMQDRTKGLRVSQLKSVLKALAGFHALSLTLKDLRPEVFTKLSDGKSSDSVREPLFHMENEDWYRLYYRTLTARALRMVSDGLPANLEPRRDEILGKFYAFVSEDKFFRMMCEVSSQESPLTVICHGDCWTNNFLFKENEDGDDSEQEIRLVDFQLTRVGSLALDLAYLLYICTTSEVRKKFMTDLLQYYHRHLMSALYTLNPNAKSTRDPDVMWKLLNEEMRRCSLFGLGTALDMLPITTCTSDEAPDFYVTHRGDESEDKKNQKEEIGATVPPHGGAECTRLMTDIVVEFVLDNII